MLVCKPKNITIKYVQEKNVTTHTLAEYCLCGHHSLYAVELGTMYNQYSLTVTYRVEFICANRQEDAWWQTEIIFALGLCAHR